MKQFILSGAVFALLCYGVSTNVNATPLMTCPTVMAAASTDWNKLLDEYEQYVDQYIKTYKKAMNGDMTAMVEYAKLLKKAQNLSDKIEKAKGEISDSQLQRYIKIAKKLSKALSEELE